MEKCLVMCWWFENKIEEAPTFLDDIWFSNKAHFWLCEHVNSNNCVYWGTSEALALCEMHGLCGHLKTLNNQTVLV